MVQFLTGSAWSVTVRRIMENIMVTLPVGAVLFIPIAIGLDQIYQWTTRPRCRRRRSARQSPLS